jgi:hypothetical protein
LILGIKRFDDGSKKDVAEDRDKALFLLAMLNLLD